MNTELAHYGLKGMKWGQRRWQYDNGRFNDAGKERYFGQKSSHRPDSVRALQGDSPKMKSKSSTKEIIPSGHEKEFDKEKAKRIAKNVAIGAAVVGGTVLVAYGGYKIHEAGGFSGVSKNLSTKMRETKLDNLKLKQEFKAEKASIKAEGKKNLAKIHENTKNELKQIHEEGKAARGKVKADVQNKAKEFARKPGEYSEHQEKYADYYRKYKNYYGTKEIVSNGRKYMTFEGDSDGTKPPMLIDLGPVSSNKSSSSKPKTMVNVNVSIAKKVKDSAVSTTKVRDVASNVTKNVKSTADKAKKVSLPKITPDHIKAGVSFLSEINKTARTAKQAKADKQQRDAAIVKMYKAQHPNTKLSDKKILDNYRSMTGS